MNRLFGAKKPEGPKPETPKVEQKKQQPQIPEKPKPTLNEQQARLQNKTRQLSQTITKLDAEAKELLEKSKHSKGSAKEMYKQRCIMVLKKRKQYEAQLKNYMTHQFTLNQVAFTSENIQNTLDMGQTMQQVIDQQKQVMKNLDLDKLDDIREQMMDMKYESDYMNEMLNRDYDIDVDEDDLDDELGQLERQLKVQKQQKNKGQIQNNQQMAI